jgi:hypothetical protein
MKPKRHMSTPMRKMKPVAAATPYAEVFRRVKRFGKSDQSLLIDGNMGRTFTVYQAVEAKVEILAKREDESRAGRLEHDA